VSAVLNQNTSTSSQLVLYLRLEKRSDGLKKYLKEILLQWIQAVSLQSALKKAQQALQNTNTDTSSQADSQVVTIISQRKIIRKKDEIKVGSKEIITTFALPSKQGGLQRKKFFTNAKMRRQKCWRSIGSKPNHLHKFSTVTGSYRHTDERSANGLPR
jgi:hypothetical protein